MCYQSGLEDGIQGQAIDISLAVREVMKDNQKVAREFSRLCGQPLVKLEQDLKRLGRRTYYYFILTYYYFILTYYYFILTYYYFIVT
jgi:hypothetical protein